MRNFNCAPFLRRDKQSFATYHTDYFIALSGPLFMAIFLYGIRAALMVAFCLVTAIFLNAVRFFISSEKPIIDPEDILTALIIPLLCPVTANLLFPSMGVFVAIAFRMLYRAFFKPKNVFLSPVCIGWIFLALVFPNIMFSYVEPAALSRFTLSVTSIAESVPSIPALLTQGAGAKLNLIDLLLGELPGPMGCSAPVVILASCLFLVIRRSIPAGITLGAIISAFFTSAILGGVSGTTLLVSSLFEISGGSFLLFVVFVASRRKLRPLTAKGQVISGVLIGILTVVLRKTLPVEQAAAFAILLVCSFSYFLDLGIYNLEKVLKYTKVKRQNARKEKELAKAEKSVEEVTDETEKTSD